MSNILDGIPVLRAARLVFERAGNKALVLSTKNPICLKCKGKIRAQKKRFVRTKPRKARFKKG